MRNSYRVKGNKAYIRLAAVNGKRPLPEADIVIDLKNLEKAQAFPGTWGQTIHQKTGELYIRGRYLKDGKRSQPIFARYLTDAKLGENTRHIDDDPLNCLECNLVNAPIGVQDVKGMEPIGPPPEPEKKPDPPEDLKPVKGVSFHKTKKKWEVKPYYNGKRYGLGYWPEHLLAEANEHAEYFREHGPEAYKLKYEGGK